MSAPDRARRHELRLLAASRPGMPVLLALGRFAQPVRRVPGLGWLVSDPVTVRRILNDPDHFTTIGEGVVGHLWARVLGDWAYDMLDGAGHRALRMKTRALFTDDWAATLVARAAGARLRRCTAELAAGGAVDVADLARIVVGRVVADLLGLAVSGEADGPYRTVYDAGTRLATLAFGSTGTTHLPATTVTAARAIVASMTGGVAAGWRKAPGDTLLGRCRELGLNLRQTECLATFLIVAGTQTTASAMGRTVALLHDTAEQDRLRAERRRTTDAVREGLRVTTPVPVITRSVGADVTVGGRRLRAGQRVLLLTHRANNAAGAFNLDRAPLPGNRQLSFGAGRHFCLGAPVGRAELSSLLDALLATGRPWRIVERRYGRGVLVPAYARLRVALA